MTNSKFSAFIALFAFTYLATIIAEPLAAQENTAPAEEDFSIQFIEVEGSQRVEADTVRSYMILKPGMTADPVLLDQSLKSMFASGLFADVTIRRERGGLIVTVVEIQLLTASFLRVMISWMMMTSMKSPHCVHDRSIRVPKFKMM